MNLAVTMYSFKKYFQKGKINVGDFIKYCGMLEGVKGVDLLEYFWKDRERDIREVPKWLRDNNLVLSAFAIGNNFLVEKENLSKEIDKVKRGVDTTKQLGGNKLRIFGGELREGIGRKEGVKIVIDGLSKVISYAQTNEVTLAIENHGGVPGTSEEVIEIINSINSPFLKALIDTSNFYHAGEDSIEAIKKLAPYAVHVHLKDHNTKNGFVPTAVGEGELDFVSIFNELRNVNYKAFMAIECETSGDDKEVVEKSLTNLRKIL